MTETSWSATITIQHNTIQTPNKSPHIYAFGHFSLLIALAILLQHRKNHQHHSSRKICVIKKTPTNSYLSCNYLFEWTLRLIDVHHLMLVFTYWNASSSLTEPISHFVLTLFLFMLRFWIFSEMSIELCSYVCPNYFSRGPNHQYFSFCFNIAHTQNTHNEFWH